MVLIFPLRSIQTNSRSPEAPLPKTSRPSLEAEASICQVLPSFITPLATFAGSLLSVPEEGLKGCAINWSPRPNIRKPAA